MSKQKFVNKLRLSTANIERLERINSILEEYREDGYVLTLRQLYYQLVSRDIIPNQQKEYAKLSLLLTKGRMAGVVDWEIIEDRVRKPHLPYWVDGIEDAIKDTIRQYRLNRQEGQENYIEVWIEKDALSGVLRRITEKYHIRLMVNRGYSSTSAMYDAYKRFRYEMVVNDKKGIILYLGDHDPSGLDMIRDIKDRLLEFGVNVEVNQIGLTQQQIKQYNPPPNPAKIKDPRAKWYIEEYGNTSWEVDALPPKILNTLVETNIKKIIDIETYESMIKKEDSDIRKLSRIANIGESLEDDE